MAAGDDQERIIQDVILSIQASIKGQKETVDQLKNINKGLGKADKSIESYTESVKTASKANTLFKKSLFTIGKGIGKISSVLGFFTGIAVGAFNRIMDVSKSFAELDTIIVRGRGGLDSFTSAYKTMSDEVGTSVTSLKDAAEAMAQFGSQSMAHMATIASPRLQKSFMKLQNIAREALGPIGDDLFKAMTNVPTDRLSLVADTIENLTPGTKAFTQAMFLASEAAGQAAQRLEKGMKNADVDPVLNAWKTWQNIQNKLSSTFENFTVHIAETFGDDIASGIEYLSKEVLEGMLIPALTVAINWIKDNKENIVNVFKETARVISVIADKVTYTAKKLKEWYDTVSKIAHDVGDFLGFGGGEEKKSSAFLGKDFYRAKSSMATNQKYIDEMVSKLSDEDKKKYYRLRKKHGATNIPKDTKTTTPEDEVKPALTLVELYAKKAANIKLMASGMESVVSQTESLNQQMLLFGTRGFGKQVTENAIKSIDLGYEQLERAKELLKLANMMPGATAKERSAKEEKINEALQAQAKATKAIESGHKNILATTTARLEQEEAVTDLHKADLDISRSLYGTPALSVTAHLNVVKALAAQKKTIEEQLRIVQNRMKVEGRTRDLALQEVRLRTKAKRITAEQLQQVKELRDGYLDAVQAQAFGAGKFEKILITQEQNLGAAMDKNIIKRNYLLGQAGDAASKSNIDPFRFSASGIGVLEGMGGQKLSPEQLAKRAAESFKNISDPTMRAYVEEAQSIIMGIHGDASKWQKESQKTAQGLITGLKNLKDTIEQRGAGVGGLKGVAGEVAAGAAFRGKGKGKGKVAGQVTSGVRGDATIAMNKVAFLLLELARHMDEQSAAGDKSPGLGKGTKQFNGN